MKSTRGMTTEELEHERTELMTQWEDDGLDNRETMRLDAVERELDARDRSQTAPTLASAS